MLEQTAMALDLLKQAQVIGGVALNDDIVWYFGPFLRSGSRRSRRRRLTTTFLRRCGVCADPTSLLRPENRAVLRLSARRSIFREPVDSGAGPLRPMNLLARYCVPLKLHPQ